MINHIFYNGHIITMDKEQPIAEAMAIQDGRFQAVGNNQEILALQSIDTVLTDLKGQTVTPGFNDSHMHLMNVGALQEMVVLTGVSSRAALIEAGQRFMIENPELQWIVGRGWNQAYFPDNKMPTRYDLDQISTEKPIAFRRACGHITVVNTKALEMAGLLQSFTQPVGGHVDVDSAGMPTGILRERASRLVMHLLPKRNKDDYKRLIKKGAEVAASLGLTTVQTDDFGSTKGMEEKLQAYQEVLAAGELPVRVNLQMLLSTPEEIESYLEIRKAYTFPPHTVSYGPLKLMTDGSLGGRTAFMHAPYSDDPSTCGVSTMTQEKINEMYRVGHKHGLQLAAHAIGDHAIQKLLNAYRLVKTEMPKEDMRPRIIHAQITTPHILEQMQQLGVVCDIQPIFVPTDMYFVEERLGKARAMQSYPWKTMRELGIPTAGGSDSPVESCNPLWGIAAAVTRQDHNGYPEAGWRPEECLPVEAAIELFTMGSAYANFDEKIKGSIANGKLADFVVLSENIYQVDPTEIQDIYVKTTFVNGQKVYEA